MRREAISPRRSASSGSLSSCLAVRVQVGKQPAAMSPGGSQGQGASGGTKPRPKRAAMIVNSSCELARRAIEAYLWAGVALPATIGPLLGLQRLKAARLQ